MTSVRPQWLGRLSYRWAWRLQHLRRRAVIDGSAPEAFWLLTHDPVITTGRRAVDALPSSVEVVRTERGGLATYHGPGQLVGYLILDVARRKTTVKGTVCAVATVTSVRVRKGGVTAGGKERSNNSPPRSPLLSPLLSSLLSPLLSLHPHTASYEAPSQPSIQRQRARGANDGR